jgi:hypothetical protein
MAKMIKLLAIPLVVMGSGAMHAQELAYFKKYGTNVEVSDQIRQTADGNLLMLSTVRRTNSLGQFIRDIQLTKTNTNGDTVWTRFLGRDERSEMARDFEIVENDDLLLTGFSSYDMGTRTQGFLMRTDSIGNLLWEKYYGSENEIVAFSSLKVINDSILLAGTIEREGNGDAFIMKTTATGDSLWGTQIGGPAYDDAWDIETAHDGGYITTGGTYSFAQGTLDDAWLVKLNNDGSLAWYKTYGSADRVDWAWALAPARNSAGTIEGYVFTGVKNSGEQGTVQGIYGDIHLVKTDTAGNVIWDKSLAIPGIQLRKEGTDIIPTSDGGFAICGFGLRTWGAGQYASNLYFAKLDADGNIEDDLFVDELNEFTTPRAITEGADGNFYITGITAVPPGDQLNIFQARINMQAPSSISGTANDITGFQLFPNPATDQVTVSLPGKEIASISLYSVDGKLLRYVSQVAEGNLTLSVKEFKGSTLFVAVTAKDRRTAYKRLVVR